MGRVMKRNLNKHHLSSLKRLIFFFFFFFVIFFFFLRSFVGVFLMKEWLYFKVAIFFQKIKKKFEETFKCVIIFYYFLFIFLQRLLTKAKGSVVFNKDDRKKNIIK